MQNLIRYLVLTVMTIGISTSYASNATQVKSSFVISDYAKTKYPIVFVHGVAGFSRVGSDPMGSIIGIRSYPILQEMAAMFGLPVYPHLTQMKFVVSNSYSKLKRF